MTTKHPVSENPPRKPDPDADGFNSDNHVGRQAIKNWERRDDPDRNKS
jgi:hypothetical protein